MLKEMGTRSQSHIKANKSDEVNILMTNYLRDYLVDQLLPYLLSISHKTLYHEIAIDIPQLSSDLKIIASRLKMINILFGTAVDMSKTDLISLDRNHPRWKQIYEVTTYKCLGNPENIKKSFDNFAKTVLLGHALIQQKNQYKNTFIQKLIFASGTVYYFLLEKQAKASAMSHISDLKVDNAIEVMNMIDQPGIRNILAMALPKIAYNKKIYIDPFVMPITLENINKEINENTINKITPINLLMVNQEIHNQEHYRKEIQIKSKSKLRIRILCSSKLENPQDVEGFDIFSDTVSLTSTIQRLVGRWFSKETQQSTGTVFDSVIVHIHGGGFISQSSGTHQCHTRNWAIETGAPIFSIDYGLAPKNPYPIGLDDCWQAYNWIVHNGSKYFSNNVIVFFIKNKDINPKKVVVCGDSAGGNLTLALTGLLIKYGQRVPDGVMVAYPAADVRFHYSPSALLSLDDRILSHTILGICIHSYACNPECKLLQDPFLSPLLLTDEILSKFPPTRILCGTKDPLVDQTWKLVSRLLSVGVSVKQTMYEEISHGFLNFNTIHGMKEIQVCIQDAADYLKELIGLKQLT